MSDYQFKLELEVRDYECDIQGIVNNAVYQNYLEHARHLFLKERDIDFIAFSKRGINLVVTRAELDYLYPLRADERFCVALNLERVSRIRFAFQQDIYRLPDDKPILKARMFWTAVNDVGRPCLPKELEELLEKAILPKGL
ncbi:MAG: acyl-CoA thioesterase [Anaerolineales bacterium]